MMTNEKTLRVLIVDDNRDGADALGLLVEELGNQVHVTYGGRQALEVAAAFRPDLMFVDLVMPDVDGFDLVRQLRQMPAFSQTKVVAVTGHKDNLYKLEALKAGCDNVLVKPAALTEIRAALACGQIPEASASLERSNARFGSPAERRLPMDEARKIRSDRQSKTLTQAESEAVICDGISRFQEEYLGRPSEHVQVHFINDLLIVRIRGVLTQAERQISKTLPPEKGRDLIKQARKQLLELARPMLESLVHEAVGVKVVSMHHDISTLTGEEVVMFAVTEPPRFQ